MNKFIKKLVFFITLIVFIFVAALMYQFIQFRDQVLTIDNDMIVFEIAAGSHIRSVAKDLNQQNIIADEWLFIILAKIEGVETKIKAGEYEIKQGTTAQQLLNIFVKGQSIQYTQSIIEGRTFAELRLDIAKNDKLKHTLEGKSAKDIMVELGLPNVHIEGQFLPDTYAFLKGSTDLEFLKRAQLAMQKALANEWEKREKGLPFKTPYEALIMASIIEKETGVAFERPIIAAAFITRLRKNMKLQTDPTIIYGMGDRFDGDIRYKDLREDTPYNTYVHKGLTPTPIAMPGLLSIQAALNPADSDAIYFVSKGDGTHYFSKTLKEHNAAVRKYQLKGRAPKRKATSGQ